MTVPEAQPFQTRPPKPAPASSCARARHQYRSGRPLRVDRSTIDLWIAQPSRVSRGRAAGPRRADANAGQHRLFTRVTATTTRPRRSSYRGEPRTATYTRTFRRNQGLHVWRATAGRRTGGRSASAALHRAAQTGGGRCSLAVSFFWPKPKNGCAAFPEKRCGKGRGSNA